VSDEVVVTGSGATVVTDVPPSVVTGAGATLVSPGPSPVVVSPVPVVLVTSQRGEQGIPGPVGPGGGGGGTQNLYVQQTQPVFTGPGLWVETNADTTLKTFWVNV